MVPFYCVIQKVCKKCENIEFKKCEKNEVECCGQREFVFEETIGDKHVVDQLCDFIILQENSVWIAHNGGRFVGKGKNFPRHLCMGTK